MRVIKCSNDAIALAREVLKASIDEILALDCTAVEAVEEYRRALQLLEPKHSCPTCGSEYYSGRQ